MVFGAPEKGSRDHVTSGDLKSPAGVKILPQHTLDWRPLHATNCHQNSKWRCETLARHWLVFEYVNGILNPIMNQGIMPCTDHLAGYQVFCPLFLFFFFFLCTKTQNQANPSWLSIDMMNILLMVDPVTFWKWLFIHWKFWSWIFTDFAWCSLLYRVHAFRVDTYYIA